MSHPFDGAPSPSARAESPASRLFVLSFTALFLELMVIRWAPSELRLVAYYANLLLVSSFLGLGLGAILCPRGWNLFRFFPLFFTVDLVLLVSMRAVALPGGDGELRFGLPDTKLLSYFALILVFLCNALVFVPLGEQIGVQFQRLPALRAYVWDLSGSLAGTLTFGVFSYLHFSPTLGIGAVIVMMVFASRGLPRRWTFPLYAVALAAVVWSSQRDQTWWSPYYFITVRENYVHLDAAPEGGAFVARLAEKPAASPPPNLRTMRDPPLYNVRVNQDFYQMHGSIDATRYTPESPLQRLVASHFTQYDLPYHIVRNPRRVLILGAGGGMDVEAALLRGSQQVDAVEIDPVIPQLSARYSSAAPYSNPKVRLHIDDARSFLQKSAEQFDLVVFGHLDSQALFSYGASLRLDGYTYTVEGFRQAFARVAPEGMMSVSFSISREWLAQKFSQMIEEATGAPPLVYVGKGTVTFMALKQTLPDPPAEVGAWKLRRAPKLPVDLATDDWPYVYLEKRGIPTDYMIVIGALLALSLGALLAFGGRRLGSGDGHFLFLGWGFLLLQTKSIGDCSLYFGATWLVTTLVIAGVLLMVLLANWVAQQFVPRFNLWLYAPLFLSLVAVLALPREFILAREYGWRVLWTVLVVPLPIFFAGLIFSTTLREAATPAVALGANLIGATLGGFCEYLGMWLGSQALGCIVIAAYAGSLLCLLRQQQSLRSPSAGGATTAPVPVPSSPR